ncbi:hypothetical protein CkaCkLH20_03968 [Colletotrichum karsti]|uniref:Adhesin domain-containing protein n=1 Tax=Colletotrichum karsti TaxID=1095194 RepID=A0A9P6LMS0_9PEZI|nr:uncharacterized protein CkaCkLH20_03968 [Colletotrichum karsti]KAF9878476.1 hypothetical protein CkaCkLH20_03968 [Colletotrichum karsti]
MPAPYSDNLYSADDSDLEGPDDDNLDAHLSPTDGYFQSSSSSAGNLYPPQQTQEHERRDTWDNVTDATLPTSAGVPHVPNVLVQDPSLQKGASSKDHEAREETRLNTSFAPQSTSAVDDFYDGASTIADSVATPSHTTYTSAAQSSSSYTPYSPSTDAPLRTPQTHPRRGLYSQPSSLFRIPREAPPAYTPSPTSPLSSSPTEFRNYQTFNTMGAPEEARHLLGRDPESMGDEPYDEDPRPQPWRERVLKRFPWASRRTLKMVLFALLMFSIFVGFLSMMSGTANQSPKSPSKEPAKQFDPVTGLPIKDGPEAPAQPSDPTKPSQPGHPGLERPLPWKPQDICAKAEHRFETKVFDLSFAPEKTLSVLQTVESDTPSRGYQPHVSGNFIVRRQLSDAPGPSIELEVVSNDESLKVEVEWESSIQQLKIKSPQRVEWNQPLRPCMTIRATVWVPENADINVFKLAALHLGVQLNDDLAISVKDTLEIRTYAGDVRVPVDSVASYRLDSRNIVVQTISGDIAGTWPLYDSLKIGSESGDIAAGVVPKPVLESRPLPAVLEVTSVSGDVVVQEPLKEATASAKPDTVIPPRDYYTSIDTKSGRIKAYVAFSTVAAITSVSGDITGVALPVYDVSLLKSVPEPELHTKTKSGSIVFEVLEPMWVEIAKTLGRDEKKAPNANPNIPVDIPTNPLPVPNIPRVPSVPSIPFIPIGARDPYRNLPGSSRRWLDLLPGKRDAVVSSSSSSSSDTRQAAPVAAVAVAQPPMRHLKSSHTTVSGNMDIKYPASWEGTVSAESISGGIDLRGRDLKIDSHTKWPRAVRAHKGQAWTCEASLGSVSGHENLTIGPEK